MKRFLFALAVSGLVSLAFANGALAKSWTYDRWDVDMTIEGDSGVKVVETQTFSFEGDFSWVTRTIPKTKGIWFDAVQVKGADGQALDPADVDIANSKSELSITVHFPKLAPDARETKTWIFEYRAMNALGDFPDHDELYWNAVGPERDASIGEVVARVHLPGSFPAESIQQRLFVGPESSTYESLTHELLDPTTLQFIANQVIPGDYVTLVAGWPKGSVVFQHFDEPKTAWEKAWAWIQWPYYLSPLLLLVWLIRRWHKGGRDPKGRSTIIAQYDPPDGQPPAIVGTLVDERVDQREVIATIIDLAVRGFLHITEEKKTGVFSKTTYTFEKKSGPSVSSLRPFERLMYEALFDGRDVVELDDLKNSFYKDLKKIKESMYKETTEAGYFEGNPESTRLRYLVAALIIGLIGFFGLFIFIAWGVLLGVFALIMPRRSPKGVAAKEWALGFKLYLHTAERYRVKAMTPETFERFLPYAMIFGVEKEWAERFSSILKTPPSWYSTNDPNFHFTSVLFASHLASAMNTTVARSLASSPSSSSGFSGGGFSGGGGGGGGGGAG
jgi:hypothetical protein